MTLVVRTLCARAIVVLGIMAAPLLGPEPLEAQTQTRPEIVSLSFDGNRAFSNTALSNAILTRQTTCRSMLLRITLFCTFNADFAVDPAFFNDRVFAQDYVRVQLFYHRRGYREVQVDTTIERRTPTSVALTFHIDEGEPVRIVSLDVLGSDDLPGGPVGEGLPAGPGDPLNFILLEAVRDTITERLRDRGYAHAEVLRGTFIPDGTRDAEVEFDVYTGPLARIGPIGIEGNEQVTETVIRRMLPFREGSVYSRSQIFEGQRNLYGLDIFRHAAILPDLDHVPDSVVPLRVQVNEGNARRVRTGGAWTSSDCFATEARWSSRNFMGGARRMVLRGRVSNLLTSALEESICSGAGTGEFARLNWLASAEFTQPWIFSPRNTFTGAIFAERQSVPDVFIREALGLNLALTRTVGGVTPVTLSFRPQRGRLSAAEVFFCTNFLVCNPRDIEILEATNLLSPVALAATRDRTNRLVAPTGGYTAALELEHASRYTGSDFEYGRAVAEATGFLELPADVVLGGRLRGGWMRASAFRGFRGTEREGTRIEHPQKRFYAGGANSVRGYAQNQLGPQVVTVGVEALIFPADEDTEAICAPTQIADLSCDPAPLADASFTTRPTGGSVVVEGNLEARFDLGGEHLGGVAFVDFGQVWSERGNARLRDVRFTPGVGLRYGTPIGPIRVDVAYRPPARRVLPVITSQIRPFDPAVDPPDRRIHDRDGEPIDWVLVDELARLENPLSIDEPRGFSWRRLQLQFSIGHAF